MYVITGATGNIGKRIAEKLLAENQKVRVIGRNKDKLKSLIDKGAEAHIGDLNDTEFLSKALTGASAAFVMIPPSPAEKNFRAYQQKMGKSIVEAISKSGIKNVIALSSVGAHMKQGAGVVQGLHDFEQYLCALPNMNVLALRPSYFMENMWFQKDLIKHMSIAGSPVKGDLQFPAVPTKDIADVAAEHLLKLDFVGQSHEYILGARDVTFNEIASILGKEVGKEDLKYVQFPSPDAKAGMMQAGLSESYVDEMIEFVEAMNNGTALSDVKRTPANSSPGTIEEFAKIFAQVYKAELATA